MVNHRPGYPGPNAKPYRKGYTMSDKQWDEYSRKVWDETGKLPNTGPNSNNGGLGREKSLKTKTSNRVAQTKLQADGRQIADLEKAVHRLKNTSSVKPKNISKGIGSLVNILGQEEERESQWLACVTDCEHFAARVPVGQTTGLVPVDLYRRTCYADGAQEMVTNGASYGSVAFGMFTTDGWHEMAGVNNAILHADGAIANTGTTTQNAYLNGNSPTYAAAVAGQSSILMPDVSSDFVSNALDGTQYMMVGQKVSMSMFLPPNASADSHFVGRAHVFQTIDPERSSLYNKSLAGLKEEAEEEGSNIFHQEYTLTPGGRFVPVGLEASETEVHQGYAEISAVSLPLNNLAYEWKTIGVNPLPPSTDVVPNANIMFVLEAPSGTSAQVRNTYVWQVERYASNKLASGGGHMPIPEVQTIQDKSKMTAHCKLLGPVITKPKTPYQPVVHSDPRSNDQVPKSVFTHSKTMLDNLGRPRHAIQAVASVISDRMSRPGIHAQVAASPEGLSNLVTKPVATKMAKIGGHAAEFITDQIRGSESKEGGGFWSSVWDFTKGLAPELLELIPLLL